MSEGFHAYEDEDRFSRVVNFEEIEKNDFNLNIARYVQNGEEEEQIDVPIEVVMLKELQVQRNDAEAQMMQFLEELGYGT